MDNKAIAAQLRKYADELDPVAPVPRKINDRYTDNGDGTITDSQHKLTWVKDPAIHSTWNEAKAACESLSFAGHSDWRMPTIQELQSIIDYTRHEPAWDTDVFGGKYDDWYWTSTICSWNSGAAWCVDSDVGAVNSHGKGNRYYVRLVRSSQ